VVTSGAGLVVGSTTITPASGVTGALVQGSATLTLNAAAGPSPGPITSQTTGDDAFGLEARSGGVLTIVPTTFTIFVSTVGGDCFPKNG
jgi:hypothetical protein